MADKLDDLEEFLKKADRAHELISLLDSEEESVVKSTQEKIDRILKTDWEEDEDGGCVTKVNKSQINKADTTSATPAPGGPPQYTDDQEGFMRTLEADANRRHEERVRREKKSQARREAGNAAFKRGDYTAALGEYEVAIRLTGWNVSLYTNSAQCHTRLGQFDEAVAACDRAIYIEEDFTKAYIQKSHALLAKGCHSEAVGCLEEGLEKSKAENKAVVEGYLTRARHLLEVEEGNRATLERVAEERKREVQHFVTKLGSDKSFESVVSAEFLLRATEHSEESRELFRALGGLEVLLGQIKRRDSSVEKIASQSEPPLYTSLFSLLKQVLSSDRLSFLSWVYSNPEFEKRDNPYTRQIILLLHKLIFADDEFVPTTLLDNWTSPKLLEIYLSGFDDDLSKPMCLLILGRSVRSTKFLSRFRAKLEAQLKVIAEEISAVESSGVDVKTMISALSALSVTETSRKILDGHFWGGFLSLLDAAPEGSVDDLLVAGMNFAVGSTALKDHGVGICGRLIEMCGGSGGRAASLLNRVLEKYPNTLLAEDKGQFAALLKVIKQRESVDSETLSTALKLLARTTTNSVQARKWVVKYRILEALFQILEENVVTKETPHTAVAVISNTALICSHCFLDESLCKKQDPSTIDLFLKHAKAEKGTVIQQNAAIALARLAKASPTLLERLRQTRGLEILHFRF